MTSLPIALSGALSAALLHFVWQGAAVALLLWVALGLLRNAPPSVRYAVCCSALGLLAVMPVITVWLLYDPPPAVSVRAVFISPVAGLHRFAAVAPVQWTDLARHWILPIWGLGVVLFSLRMMWFCGQAAWMRRRGDQASDWLVSTAQEIAMRMGVAQKFRLLVSAKADGPSVIGWLRPVIVVPAATITGLTPDQLEAVLAHELAHILRADYLVNLLQSLIETLLFYHPAVWWISGRIRCERELCCDDLAVCACGDALTYARALSVLEKLRMSVPRMAMASTAGPLSYRIRRIVGVGSQAAGLSKAPAILALMIVLAPGTISLNRARAQAPQPPVPVAPSQAKEVSEAPETATGPAVQPPVNDAAEQKPEKDTNALSADLLRRDLERLRGNHGPNQPGARRFFFAQANTGNHPVDPSRIEDLRQQLDALRKIYTPEYPEVRRLQALIQQLEAQTPPPEPTVADQTSEAQTRLADLQRTQRLLERDLAAYEASLASLEAERNTEPEQRNRAPDDILTLRRQITYLQNELKLMSAFSNETFGSAASGDALGPEVARIVFPAGLTDVAQQQLLLRLPASVGSRLSSAAIRQIYSAVKGFDENLEFSIVMLSDGKAELRITATTK